MEISPNRTNRTHRNGTRSNEVRIASRPATCWPQTAPNPRRS